MPNKMPTRPLTTAERASMKKQLSELYSRPSKVINDHGYLGHSTQSHVNVDDATLLNNVIRSGGKIGDTVFNDAKTQQATITRLLKAKIADIIRFTSDAKPGDKAVFYAPFTNEDGDIEPIGHGFIGQPLKNEKGVDIGKPIQAISTNIIGMAIQKDPKMPDGWKLLTAFPASRIEKELNTYDRNDVQITTIPDFDFEPVLHATESYQHASPIQRALLDYNNIDRKTMAAIPVQYVPRRNGREEQIIVPMPQGRYAGESVIITGDERAAASRTGSFPLPTVIERVTEHLMKKVNDQITQVETDRRARKLAAARDMQDMKIINAMNPGDTETGPGTGNDEPGIT